MKEDGDDRGCRSHLLVAARKVTKPGEAGLARAAAAIVGLHLLDVASWRPALVLGAALLVVPRLPATLRAGLAAVGAAGAATGGFLHVLHIRWDGLGRTDVTGVLLFAAAALFAASATLALLSRRPLRPWRRAGRIAATAAGAIPLILFVVLPLVIAMWLGGKPRRPLEPATFPLAHSDVELRAKDGTKLSGWYVPSRNGAAVVLVHGGGGDRNGVRLHALLLARHGYGVLLYDERGRGRSGGTNQAMGWNWVQDVEAAVDYARAHGARRVGVLGLSTGAEVVVTAAAHDERIRAVVAEGVINRDLADTTHQRASDNVTGFPYWAVTYAALAVETGTRPPEPLTEDLLRKIAPRPLLIVASKTNTPEAVVAPAWKKAAGPTAQLWLVQAGHTKALATYPRQYERRVVGLFDRALDPTRLPRSGTGLVTRPVA